ncbi:MAG: putative toxin-antitoxin system toxin component, PIN family [Acidimicrobiales bacterium]
MLVVLDPNIFVSALITPTGVARSVVQAGIEGRFEYAVCPRLLAELDDVARRPKIARLVAADAAGRFVTDVRGGARVEPDPQVEPISRDPNDDYLIALSIAVGAGVLVTGDADLLNLGDPPVRIIGLREFADLLGG